MQGDTFLVEYDLKKSEDGLGVRSLVCFPILQIVLTKMSKITFLNKANKSGI